MEVDERPTEQYGDIGGLDKQIQEVCQPIRTYKGVKASAASIFFLFSSNDFGADPREKRGERDCFQ